MFLSELPHIIIHSLIDSLKVFLFILLCYIILSFIETKISKIVDRKKRLSPVYGSLIGIIPQCGISVVAQDMYLKDHLSMGTLLAIFISCSDEALPLLLAEPSKYPSVLPLIISKLVIAIIVGIAVDFIYHQSVIHAQRHKEHCTHEKTIHIGCCHHNIDDEQESKLSKHFLHPLLHSLKITLYVFLIYIIFESLFKIIGEENIMNFLQNNKYFSPLFAVIIGLIPNCSSSIIISELYIMNAIGFGAALGGLCVNAGLGLWFLFKNAEKKKKALIIMLILIIISIIVGYASSLILQFK